MEQREGTACPKRVCVRKQGWDCLREEPWERVVMMTQAAPAEHAH